jgi:hypothetical protein
MAKTPQQANEKWVTSTAMGQQAWLQGLQQTTKPIVGAAVANAGAAISNYSAALAPGGVWQRNLEAVGDAGIKAAAATKAANYTTGVQQGAGKQLASITKILAYEAAGLPQIYAMPSGTTGAGIARATAWIQYMAAGRGQLGA